MIYTSNFYKAKFLNSNKYDFYSIARYDSKYIKFEYKKILLLAPTSEILFDYKENRISEKEYTDRYIKLLESRGLDRIKEHLVILQRNTNKEILLLCHCGKDKFCHRHILTSIFSDIIEGEL